VDAASELLNERLEVPVQRDRRQLEHTGRLHSLDLRQLGHEGGPPGLRGLQRALQGRKIALPDGLSEVGDFALDAGEGRLEFVEARASGAGLGPEPGVDAGKEFPSEGRGEDDAH